LRIKKGSLGTVERALPGVLSVKLVSGESATVVAEKYSAEITNYLPLFWPHTNTRCP